MNNRVTQNDNTVDNNSAANDLPIKGRFARYTSAFLSLMLPLLATRYLWVAIEDINPFNFLRKSATASEGGIFRYMSRNVKAFGMGATVMGILGLYSKHTMDDIKTLYAEAVGYEMGKKKEDVTFHDVFFKSQNSAVAVTRHDLLTRSLARFGTAASFLVPWHLLRKKIAGHKRNLAKDWDTNLNAGVGAMGTYLSLDGFFRSQTFFEAQQVMVDNAINHADANISNVIKPAQIQSLLLLHRKRHHQNYAWPQLDSKEGANEAVLAARIADLMNQTYNNAPNTEHAHFTLGKFNYLVGFGMLDHYPESLAFVELANKSPDMKEVKAASEAIKKGQDPQAVFQSFGIDINQPAKKNDSPVASVDQTAVKFAENVQTAKNKVPAFQRTHQEFAENVPNPQMINP